MLIKDSQKSAIATSGIAKREHYKWKDIEGVPGTFMWIDKKNLQIDPEYQRDQDNNRVIQMAKNWSWIACGALVVARRGQEYFVVDGGNRTVAAYKRDDIEKLPCMVHTVTKKIDEAEAFLATNLQRRSMRASEKFRALLLVGDQNALLIKELCDITGTAIGDNASNGLKAVGIAMRCARDNRDELIELWELLVELSKTGIAGPHSIHERLLVGLVYLQNHLKRSGCREALHDQKWRKRLLRIGRDRLLNAAEKACAAHARGGAKRYAIGFLAALNHGLRDESRLPEIPTNAPECA